MCHFLMNVSKAELENCGPPSVLKRVGTPKFAKNDLKALIVVLLVASLRYSWTSDQPE